MNTPNDAHVDVSIIIVNYNTPELTLQCIRSIHTMVTRVHYEIIVIDNHSADGSVDLLRAEDIMLLCNDENVGFGRANNKGAEYAKGNYLFFINSDTYFLNDAASILFAFMEAKGNERVACCGGMLLTPSNVPQASYGNFPSVSETVFQLGLHRFLRKQFVENRPLAVKDEGVEVKEVDYITGADLFIRSTVFRQLGGFDPDFFLYFEETELAWRVKRAGFSSMWVPEARIVHLEGGGNGGQSKWSLQKIRAFTKSRHLYFRKTKGRWATLIVKVLLAMHALALWVYRREKYYFNVFRIIVAS